MSKTTQKAGIESSTRTKRKAPVVDDTPESQIAYFEWKIIVLRQSIAAYHDKINKLKQEIQNEDK